MCILRLGPPFSLVCLVESQKRTIFLCFCLATLLEFDSKKTKKASHFGGHRRRPAQVCLSLDLCIVTWTVLVCTWGPGSALRGPNGMKSFHETLALLKEDADWLRWLLVHPPQEWQGPSLDSEAL